MNQKDLERVVPGWLRRTQHHTVTITDLEGVYLWVNDVFRQRFSYLGKPLEGLPFAETVHPEDVSKCLQAAEYCMHHPRQSAEVVIRKPEYQPGKYHWTHWEFSMIRSEAGDPMGILCLGHDITSQQRIKEMLEGTKKNLAAILDSSLLPMILVDPHLYVITHNRAARQVAKERFQTTLHEGESLASYISSRDHRAFRWQVRRVLRGRSAVFEYPITWPNEQKPIWHRVRLSPAYDEDQEIMGVTLQLVNIAERKAMEQALRESEERFHKLITYAPNPILLANEENTVVYANPAMDHCLGYAEGELEGKPLDLLIPEALRVRHREHVAQYHQQPTATRMVDRRELVARHQEGHLVPVEIALNNFSIGKDQYVVAIFKDLSGEKDREVEIAKQRARLEQIAFQQSHKVRAPLANLMGSVTMLTELKEHLSEEEKEQYLDAIRKECHHLDEVIHSIVEAAVDHG